jgi:aminoglycoside 6'-N-acetyltransferase
MTAPDLGLVEAWLRQPEVAAWYLAASSVAEELDELRRCIDGTEPTEALVVLEDRRPIGWCQWYVCADYPAHARGIGAEPGDVGIDYAIGEPSLHRRGLGTALVAELVAHVRRARPGAGVIADPEATNLASRRVLEKNGFVLVDERRVESEPTGAPTAIYRLPSP